MCTCATEVSTTITSGGQNGLVSTETVEGPIFHIQSDDTNTFSVLHDEVEGKVFNEEVGVVPERLPVECMQDGMPRSVRSSSTTVSLTALPKLEGLTTERPLVDLAINSTREWHTKVFQLHDLISYVERHANPTTDLNDSIRGLTTHVVDSVLVTKPVRTFDLFSSELVEFMKEM